MYRKFFTLKMKIRQFGITFLAIGGILLINNIQFSTFFLVIGALLFAFYYFLSSFNEIRKDPNWELAFPELALGVVQEDKIEYEEYISGNERISYRIFHISRAVFILSLSMKFFFYSFPEVHLIVLSQISDLTLFISGMILASYFMLSIFEPTDYRLNWELVFPELKEKNKQK